MRYCALFVISLPALAQMAWRDLGQGRLELTDKDKPVLVYNYGPQLPAGVPEDRRRCCYVAPIYTPDGVVVTDDFPKDHYHQRGMFWAWPHVDTPDAKLDGWMLKGVGPRFVKWLEKKPGLLRVENGWFAGDRQIIRETLTLRVDKDRIIHIEVVLEALDQPVTLTGSLEEAKGYGGLSVRFAPRTDTLIRTNNGVAAKDEDLVPHTWAELEGTYGGKRAVLRIAPDPANPGEPNLWCLRAYGFLGASYPARTPRVIDPGRPLTLRYRISVSDVR